MGQAEPSTHCNQATGLMTDSFMPLQQVRSGCCLHQLQQPQHDRLQQVGHLHSGGVEEQRKAGLCGSSVQHQSWWDNRGVQV